MVVSPPPLDVSWLSEDEWFVKDEGDSDTSGFFGNSRDQAVPTAPVLPLRQQLND